MQDCYLKADLEYPFVLLVVYLKAVVNPVALLISIHCRCLLLRNDILTLPSIFTEYCQNGCVSTIIPDLSHRLVLAFWQRTLLPLVRALRFLLELDFMDISEFF